MKLAKNVRISTSSFVFASGHLYLVDSTGIESSYYFGVTFRLIDGEPGPPVVNYHITVVTGRKRGSGTDANVFINIVGTNGRVDNVSLDNSKNNFESGQTDKFQIQSLDLGEIKEITIGHDNTGLGPGWFMDKVYIENDGTKQKWMFPCNEWFDKSESDGKIVRNLSPGTVYELKVTTGKDKGAGTDSNIFCKLHGKKGTTGELLLKYSDKLNKFEAGQTDVFSIGNPDLGPLTAITLRSDDKGAGSDWLLEKVDITDEATGTVFKAQCSTWFNKKMLEKKFNLS